MAGKPGVDGLRWTATGLRDFAEQVERAMNAERAADGSRLCDEGFGAERNLPEEWPDGFRWVACYWVTGDSEGHYCHLDVVRGYHEDGGVLRGKVIHVGQCKTFLGADRAASIARVLAEIAGA